jgi:hypothetical protein
MDNKDRGRKAPSKVADLNAHRYKRGVLDAYDRLQRAMDREKREQRAEVERKGRESL